MRSVLALACLLCCLVASVARASDASDCEDEAGRLRREASDAEDAARDWGSMSSDPDTVARRRRNAQSAAATAYDRAGRMMRACGDSVPRSMAAVGALANIKGFLMLRFGETPATRARIAEVEASLQGLAQIHARVRPPDYGMTYAVAEAIFSEGR